jgi:hypothetical protein
MQKFGQPVVSPALQQLSLNQPREALRKTFLGILNIGIGDLS